MIIANAAADVTTYFVLRDSTNHAPKTDVTVTDIDLYYVEQGAAISAKADATALAAADSAHADNKAYHVGQGLYRIDWPDAAFDGGIGTVVTLIIVCTGVDTTFLEVELSPPVNVQAISADATAADNCELMFDGTGYAGGTTKLGVDVVALSGDATAADNAESFFDGTGYAGTNNVIPTVTTVTTATNVTTVNGLAAGVITAAAIASNAIDADALAADAVTEIWAGSTAPTAATIADAVWDEAATGHTDAGKAGAQMWTDVDAILADTGTDGVVVASLAAGSITAAAIATGAIDADALAADAVDEILDEAIGDGTLTLRQALRVITAALAGKLSGAATTSITIRNTADSANVIVATVDSDGNRSAVTLNP